MNQTAMLYGTYLGLFGIFTFLLFPLATYQSISLLYVAMNIASLFVAYYLTRTYRNRVAGGVITFLEGWWFTMMMYLYSSLLLAAAYYIYFRYFDNGALMAFVQSQYDLIASNASEVPAGMLAQLKEMMDMVGSMSPIDMAINRCAGNMMIGFFVGIVIALFVRRTKPQSTL